MCSSHGFIDGASAVFRKVIARATTRDVIGAATRTNLRAQFSTSSFLEITVKLCRNVTTRLFGPVPRRAVVCGAETLCTRVKASEERAKLCWDDQA